MTRAKLISGGLGPGREKDAQIYRRIMLLLSGQSATSCESPAPEEDGRKWRSL